MGCAAAVTAPTVRQAPVFLDPIPHEAFSVVPAELGDPDIEPRLHHRLHLERYGKLWLASEDRAPIETETNHHPADYPVIAATRTRAQIVISDDHHARYAVWIAREDAQPVALIDDEIAPGATVLAGAPLELGASHGERRDVKVIDEAVALTGAIASRAIGDVWIVRRAEPSHTTDLLPGQAAIHTRPDGPVVATTLQAVEVRATSTQGAWREVEYRDARVRVRGFVPASALSPDLHVGGTGFGGDFGVSDTSHVVVPAHACLFDRIGGEVIGVETAEHKRYAHRPAAASPGWWTVFVYSPWSGIQVMAHELADGTWESCASVR